MTSRIFALAALLPIATTACFPTRDGLRERRPTLARESLRTVDAIAGCIGDVWQKLDGETNMTPRTGGATITWGLTALVDIQDRGSSRQVTMHGPYSIQKGMNQRRVDEVLGCL